LLRHQKSRFPERKRPSQSKETFAYAKSQDQMNYFLRKIFTVPSKQVSWLTDRRSAAPSHPEGQWQLQTAPRLQ